VIVRPKGPAGHSFNRVKLALGDDPEVASSGSNTSLETAQPVNKPVTINGKLTAKENYFRFRAVKGEKLVLEVNASRLGSPLDSIVEVVDAKGKLIERAVVRCLLETSLTLRDHDSVQPGMRLLSPTGLAVNDYVMIGSEIVQLAAMPRGPDDDAQFAAFGGQRLAMFDTPANPMPTMRLFTRSKFIHQVRSSQATGSLWSICPTETTTEAPAMVRIPSSGSPHPPTATTW